MEVTLTLAQFEELELLVLAMQNPLSQAGVTSLELQLNTTKVEYDSGEVKFTLTS